MTTVPRSTGTDEIADAIAAFEASLPFALDPFQREAIEKLERTRGVLVAAPTSSGKTLVAEYPMWRSLLAPEHLRRRHARVIYTSPLKALSNQKYHDLAERYGDANVGLVTGEHTVNDGAPLVVMTTEILRNVLYDEPARLDAVSDVVLDEIHYIDDHPRGTVWEEIIIETPAHVRLIGLSATISNVDEVAAWMRGLRGDIATVVRTERPVPLEMWLSISNHLEPLFDAGGRVARRTLDMAANESMHEAPFRYMRRAPDNDLFHVIDELRLRSMLPAIYFIFSRRGCAEALSRCAVHGLDLTDRAEKEAIDARYGEIVQRIEDADERRVFRQAIDPVMLRHGVAMHHAGMLPSAKEAVERLFIEGLVKVVFATETLSLGLNMPARACVVSSFTKFDGTGFHSLTAGELTQLMGRAGRRGIDAVGHGVILKESDVDVRDIYEAAIGGEMSVDSKFAPTYTMVLSLLRTRSVERAEELLDKSFGQYQNVQRADHWTEKRHNLEEQLVDRRGRVFRHPRVACTERTLATHLSVAAAVEELQVSVRRVKREHWRDSRRGRHGGRGADPGQRFEAMRRELRQQQQRLHNSPCRSCPYFGEHRAHRAETRDIEETLEGGEAELEWARHRYRREFGALRRVLHDAGFLENDAPNELGLLAASLFGENALLIADAIVAGHLGPLSPPELAAALVTLVAEDRGRERAQPSRRHFPTPRVELAYRRLRGSLQRLAALEREQGLQTLRPLSLDYINAAHQWASGAPLAEIETPAANDIGDVVKAMKNLYSMLRQMEQALREHPLHARVRQAREAMERDLIRRV
ncbi:MAG: DEAD/DEAH box helicase [Candidatus Dormibacteraeota bacterium]|uniref:DEAD/DEAH box helicase n=1 Tax=Candidatus Aeolococcus gillhamiae TaxID=3127015 RepID=A0A934N5Q0_9BACT|nr:DEAD/DEAH box helicase [Candidatus Dormibacteraeota bacterium]